MAKPFRTHNYMLKLMRKRNILIGKGVEGSQVKNILARENYYSIINGYKDIFLDTEITESTGEDYYLTGTTFFQIYGLYSFDRNLRNIFMKALLQAEQNICTKVAYRFAEKNQSEFSHLNINNFSKADLTATTRLIATLSSVTQRNSKAQDSVFYHYLTNHQDLPLWVLVTKLTFGEITHFYKAMIPSLQEAVLTDINKDYTKEFGTVIKEPTSKLIGTFNDILDTLVAFRNVCAHGDRLYNHRVKYGKNVRKLLYYFIDSPKGSEASLYGALLSLRLFLTKSDYTMLVDSFLAEIKLLRKDLPTAQFNMLLNKMELTLHWETTLEHLK